MKSQMNFNRMSTWCCLMVMMVSLLTAVGAGANVVFTFDCDVEGWFGSGSVSISHERDPGRLIQNFEDDSPFDPVIQRSGLSINGDTLQEVAIHIEISGWGSNLPIGFFFFTADGVTQIPLGEFNDGTHTIRFNAATAPTGNPAQVNWAGSTIQTIRFDMPDAGSYAAMQNARVDVRWISVTDDPEFVPVEDTTDCDVVPYIGTEKVWFTPLGAAPQIDGHKDALWDNLPWYRMSDIITAAVPASAEDISGQFKAGYHDNAMYLFIEVTDDVSYGNPADQPWQRDSVELYVDLPRVADDIGDASAQAAAWANNGGPSQMRFQHDGASRGFGAEEGNMSDSDNVFATVRNDSTGKTYYEVQLNTPANIDLHAVEDFGFLIQVNDSDGPNALDKPVIGWWGGPEQPWGQYNSQISVPVRPWQNSSVLAEGGFTGPLALSVYIQGPNLASLGQNFTLNAVALHAVGTVSYQWYKNGVAIQGAVDPFYEIVDAVEEDSGLYTVTVTDDQDTVTSSGFNLVVGTQLPLANTLVLLTLISLLVLAGATTLVWKRRVV